MLLLREYFNEETIVNILLLVHSWLRWVIFIVAVIAIVRFLWGWLGGREYKGMDRGLMAGFSGLMDLQATLGLILLLWSGFSGLGFPRYRLEHAFVMIAAAVVAHLSARWKNAEHSIRFRNHVLLIAISLVLVVIGIAVLPGGLSR
jgi:hypothetical protein